MSNNSNSQQQDQTNKNIGNVDHRHQRAIVKHRTLTGGIYADDDDQFQRQRLMSDRSGTTSKNHSGGAASSSLTGGAGSAHNSRPPHGSVKEFVGLSSNYTDYEEVMVQSQSMAAGPRSLKSDSQNRGKKSSSSSAATLKVPSGGGVSRFNQAMIPQQIQPASYSFMELDPDEVAVNTGGKSTKTKKIHDLSDLNSFKDAKQQIIVMESAFMAPSHEFDLHPKHSSSSKKRGLTQHNVQKMINTEGPLIAGPSVLLNNPAGISQAAKTNPTSMRDKIRIENPSKKILTPKEGGNGGANAHQVKTSSAISGGGEISSGGGSNLVGGQSLLQRQLILQQDNNNFYASEQVSAKAGLTSGTSSIKHHESISGASGNEPTGKGRGNKRSLMTTNLTDVDKKHLGINPARSKATNGNTHNGSHTTKNSTGRGAGGSIDLQSGSNTLSMMKLRSIQGQKVSEVTVQSNALKPGHNQQPTSFHATLPASQVSKHQSVANIQTKQGGAGLLSTAMLSTPQKFRLKNTSQNQSGKKAAKTSGANYQPGGGSNSVGPQSVSSTGAGDQNQRKNAVGPYQPRERDSSETQRLSGMAGKSSMNNSTGPTRKVNLMSNQLSKVTSEKKLIRAAVGGGGAGSTISDASRMSPRDTVTHGSNTKVDSKSFAAGQQRMATTGKKHQQAGQTLQTQMSQKSYMNEYLVKSQKNMKQLQQFQAHSGGGSDSGKGQVSHHQLVSSNAIMHHNQREPSKMMSTTLVPQSQPGGLTKIQGNAGQMTPNSSQNNKYQRQKLQNETSSNGHDLKKKKGSQGSMRNLKRSSENMDADSTSQQQALIQGVTPSQLQNHQNAAASNRGTSVNAPIEGAVDQRSIGSLSKGSRRGGGSQGTTVQASLDIAPINDLNVYQQHAMLDIDSLQTTSLHNVSDMQQQPVNSQLLSYNQSQSLQQKNLFYKVQDSTLVQDNGTEQEIEYLEGEKGSGAPSLTSSVQRPSKKPTTAHSLSLHHAQVNHIFAGEKIVDQSNSIEDDVGTEKWPRGDIIEGSDDLDAPPVVAELIEDHEIFSRPCSSERQQESQKINALENLDGFIDHRNIDSGNQHSLNIISGQKTEINDRKEAKLFKKKIDRSMHVKSLIQPATQSNEIDNMIYNARSGGPSQNFNFAKNSRGGTRPTSTKHGSGPKTMTCWTGSLAQAGYNSSSKHLGAMHSSKNNQRSLGVSNFNSTFTKGGSTYTKTSSHSAQKGNSQSKHAGSSAHQKNPSVSSKDIYKITGKGNKASKTNTSHQSTLPQQVHNQKNESSQKVKSSSFEMRPGSQSMSYIPPRRIQDQSLGLIQVPLSRAELNNQSAYHLADSQFGNNVSVNASHSQHHQSISYSKDDVRAFNRSITKESTPGKKQTMVKQRIMYQTSATVVSTSKHQGTSQQQQQLPQPFKAQNTMQGSTTLAHGPKTSIDSPMNQIFSRSQSNQQISTTQQIPHTTQGHQEMSKPGRHTNSQSRGKQRDHSSKLVDTTQPNNLKSGGKTQNTSNLAQGSNAAQGGTQGNYYPGSTKKTGSSTSKAGSSHQSKLQRKNHQNNLKMSTMQLRDQDFKKITSQIQSQTMTNVKKKKMQFQGGSTTAIGGSSLKSKKPTQDQSMTGQVSNSTVPNSQTRLQNQPPGSVTHDSQKIDLSQKFMQTSKIYSPHRRSIQQVSNSNIRGAYLNPIEGGADLQQDGAFCVSGAGGPNTYNGNRKFAYSLTDKYKGSGFEELLYKQPVLYSGSHVSSSDGGASYVIPSEIEPIPEPGISGAQPQPQKQHKSQRRDKASSKPKVQSNQRIEASNMASSQGNLPLNSQQNINSFFPDPCATFVERRKSSIDRASGQHPTVSKQSIAMSRGSSKHIEPHRLVKVSKPFQGSTFESKNAGATASTQKMSPIDTVKKSTVPSHKIQKSKAVNRPQQPQPTTLLNTNPNTQKKSVSFGAGYKEPQQMSSSSLQKNMVAFQSHQVKAPQGAGKGATSTAPVSHNSTQNDNMIQFDSGCQSPEQPCRKKQMHLNSHGPGSLIANANLIRQSPHQANRHGDSSLTGSFVNSNATAGHANTMTAVNGPSGQKQNVIGKVSASSLPQKNQDGGGLSQSKTQLTQKGHLQVRQEALENLQSNDLKSPGKKAKKLSHKIQAAGYTAQLSTATKKILTGDATGNGSSAIPSPTVAAAAYQGKEWPDSSNKVLSKDGQKRIAYQTSSSNIKKVKEAENPGLELINQQSSDQPKKQNIQLLRQVHYKQITTASKGKDSGSVQNAKQGIGQGKSFSVLVPSAESVAMSKAILLEGSTAGQKAHHVVNLMNDPMRVHQGSFANSAEKGRRHGCGGSLIVNNDTSPVSEHNTPVVRSERSHPITSSLVGQVPDMNANAKSAQKQDFSLDRARVPHAGQGATSGINIDDEKDDLAEVDPNAQEQSSKKTSFVSQKYNMSQNQKALNVIEERLESQDSAVSDPNLSPRSRHILKTQKKIRFAFLKSGMPPETQTENYKIGKVMGKGAFGKVNLAIHRLSSKFVALKSINKQFLTQEQSKRKVMQEFNILRRTRHCNIVRLYESFETQQHIVFVMEVCGGGDLLTYVRRRRKLKEDTASFLFKQIITGLAYCHTKNVLHRDIKLDNILLTSQGDVKICDFGVSKLVTPGETMSEQCGTPAYIAPEVFKNLGYNGFASDIWSAGVVLYAMLFGAVPFKASNMAELHKQVLERQPTYKEEEISSEALQLLKGILEKDPNRRLTSDQILQHQWMTTGSKKHHKVSVFTNQEKEGIVSEFEYYNKRERDVIVDGEHQVVPTDPFAEQMLSSTQNSELKNASTRSIILAPFNSTKSQLVYDEDEKIILEMLVPRQNIKYSAKVKEIDRQYELNNNADLDNGVYHQDEDEEETKEDGSPPAGSNPPRPTEERPETRLRTRALDEASIADSFNQEQLHSQLDELDEANNSINSAELDEHGLGNDDQPKYVSPASGACLNTEHQPGRRKQISEWRQLEKQMMKGDFSDKGSPPKQTLFNQKIFKEIKGDKAIPDSGENGQDLLDQSYEQVHVELCEDDLTPMDKEKSKSEVRELALMPSLGEFSSQSKQGIGQKPTVVIDEGAIGEIEKNGYPKPYIMASLNNDDLNHVTTFYYLLQTQKEY